MDPVQQLLDICHQLAAIYKTTNGTVSGKIGAFQILSCAGTSGQPTAPTVAGLNVGMDAMAGGGVNIWSTQVQYFDFIALCSDYRGRMLYEYIVSLATDEFRWYVAANGSNSNMRLTASGLLKNCTAVSNKTNDQNQWKPLDHAVHVLDLYTTATPQSHKCGFVAQSLQQIWELINVVIGGGIGQGGQHTLRCFSFNVCIFICNQINAISKWYCRQQQLQIETLKQK